MSMSRVLPDGQKLSAAADREMESLAGIVFAKQPELTQLPMFMMMSYAERLSPGAIYQNSQQGSHGALKARSKRLTIAAFGSRQ